MVSMITRCLDGDRDVMIMMLARGLVTSSGFHVHRPLPMTTVSMIIVVRLLKAGRRLQHGITDVLRHGLASTVITAIADPVGQLGHRGARGVVPDRGRLRDRICINSENARPAREHSFRHVFRRRPLRSGHFQNGGQCRSRHLLLHINSDTCCSRTLEGEATIPSGGIATRAAATRQLRRGCGGCSSRLPPRI